MKDRCKRIDNDYVNGDHSRNNLLLLLSLCAFGLGLVAFTFTNRFSESLYFFIAAFLLTFTGMLGLRNFWPKHWGAKHIMVIAVIARAVLLPVEQGGDVHHYFSVQRNQIESSTVANQHDLARNTGTETGSTPEYKQNSIAYLQAITDQLKGHSPFLFKTILALVDLGTLFLLILYLKSRGSRLNEALLYAANPLILYAFSAQGQTVALMLFTVALSLLLLQKKRFGWMFLLIGCTGAFKPVVFLALPLLIRKDSVRLFPLALLPAAAVIIHSPDLLGGLKDTLTLATDHIYIGFGYTVLSQFLSNQMSSAVTIGIFALYYSYTLFLTPDPIRACANTAVAFLILWPAVHLSYFTVIALFSVLCPVKFWIVLTGTAGLFWPVGSSFLSTGNRVKWLTVTFLQYMLPFITGLLYKRNTPEFSSPDFGPPQKISVIIPVLNEEAGIGALLQLISFSYEVNSEIIVVDGGSSDNTESVVKSVPGTIFAKSDLGRGTQIAKGVKIATGDLIVIIHADTVPNHDCMNEIFRFCSRHPWVCGGSVKTKYNSMEPRFLLITLLNNLRSELTGISFGDQVQFFRKEALADGFPNVKLMEDIELSMLLKECGTVSSLSSLANSSVRRWKSTQHLRNMQLVISLTVLYLLRRRFNLLQPSNEDFYRKYYGTS